MSKTIHLIVYKSPLFPAHWALWVPSAADTNVGKRIHVEGDAAAGFRLSFDRNYDVREESRKHEVLAVGEVGAGLLIDTPRNGVNGVDSEPQDAVERVAARVPPPGPSLVSAVARAGGTRVEIKNCQSWLTEVVRALRDEGILDSSAVEMIKMAPKN